MSALPATLVTLSTDDGWRIDAGHLAPPRPSRAGVLVVHGKTGNFYSGPSRFVAAAVRGAGYHALALNMRCHDLGYARDDKEAEGHLGGELAGGAWETIADGHRDLRAGIDYLRDLGCDRIVLVGHSSGGFYVADYADRDPDVTAFVFLSPLLTNRTAIPHWFPTQEEQDRAYAKAQSMIAEGKGHLLIALSHWYYAISARSLVERMDEKPGRWQAAMTKTRAPVLMLVGGRESRVPQWKEATANLRSPVRDYVEIAGCGHYYVGFEDAIAAAVTGFLQRTLESHLARG